MGIEVGFRGASDKPDFNLLIEKNKIVKGHVSVGAENVAGIGIFTGEEGAMVRNNIIRGEAEYGILADHVNNSVFKGNNLQGFSSSKADYGLLESDGNTIVGEGKATVQDLGSGNIITGMTRVKGDESIGERIREAQQRRKDILEAFRDVS